MVLKREKFSTRYGMFRPLEKKRYSEQIAELIQERILKDRLEIGTLLPTEKDLAQEFQVSRSVLREALRILEVSGLVDIKKGPTGGIFVTDRYGKPIKKSLSNMIASGEVSIDHLFDVRMLIEPYIAIQASRNVTDENLNKIRKVISECSKNMDDVTLLKRNNLNFHLLLAEASGNPILSTLLESVLKLLVEISLDFLDLDLERHFFKNHMRIFEAIENKRHEHTEELMKSDILNVMEKLKVFKERKMP